MRSIAASLDSQQSPSSRSVNFTVSRDRAVLALEGGAPGDLDFRFRMNRIFRSGLTKTQTVSIRRPKKSAISWRDTLKVSMSDIEEADKGVNEEYSSLVTKCNELNDQRRSLAGEGPSQGQPETGSPTTSKVTKKGKVITYLAEIQKVEELDKAISECKRKLKLNESVSVLIRRTLENASSTLSERLQNAHARAQPKVEYSEFLLTEESSRVRHEVPLPKLTSPVVGITVTHNCAEFLLESSYGQLAAFLDRHPVDPIWYAPQDAIKDGKVLPLSQEARSFLIKNSRSKTFSVKSMDKPAREKAAWRWLIISYNSLHPLARVPLDKSLSVNYERKVARAPGPRNGRDTEIVRELRSTIDGLRTSAGLVSLPLGAVVVNEDSMDTFLVKTRNVISFLVQDYAHFEGFAYALKDNAVGINPKVIPALNQWMEMADSFSQGKLSIPPFDFSGIEGVMNRAEEIPSSRSTTPVADSDAAKREDSTDVEPPESFDEGDLVWFREDIDLVNMYEGQVYLVKHAFGVEYHALQGKPTKSEPMSDKKKGKQPLQPEGKPVAGPSKTKVVQPAVPKGSGGTSASPPTSPLSQENPLKVKGEAKSKALSDAQRVSLRQYFGLVDGLIPAEEWKSMSNSQRAAAMKVRSIPRWASSAVLARSSNLELILSGKLTKDNCQSALEVTVPKRKGGSSQALEAWQRLKSDFKGVTLLRQPVTGKEKAFKKRFDSLVADYGDQKCFPKLRERPDQQGRGRSPQRGATGSDQFGPMLQMATAFGQIAKALRGT
nr:MAG: hypothetical protein [Plasmopara viticola lesion associated orfanplasmovirus 5]